MTGIFTELSSWLILPCILVSILYSYLLYKKTAPWSKRINNALFIVRAAIVFILCLLLLEPILKHVKNYFEKPILVFAIDNSQSIELAVDSVTIKKSLDEIKSVTDEMVEKGYKVEVRTLDQSNSLENLSFNHKTTQLDALLKNIQSEFENRNLANIVLYTDGIYNQGISPIYVPFDRKIFTIGIGDTSAKADLNLKTVYANKIAYMGNKFPIVAEVINSGFEGKSFEVQLKKKGKVIDKKEIKITKDNQVHSAEFVVKSEEKGLQHFNIVVKPLEDEFTIKNNSKNVYIDIIDGKEKILLVAASPHPDIKAIKSAIEKNKNYDFKVYIPGNTTQIKRDSIDLNDKYSLVILHQIPNSRNIGRNILNDFKKRGVAMWYILGNQSNISVFNNINDVIKIKAILGQTDKVTPAFNNNFDKFLFEDDYKSVLTKFPPTTVPFGKIQMGVNTNVVLFQRVGSITTEKPLLVVNEDEKAKSAVLLGEGIWQWRLQEFAQTQKHEAFDKAIIKLVQYLSTKEDKRKFRVYPISDEFYDTEGVVLETEAYNDVYEKTYGQTVSLKVTDENNSKRDFTYINSQDGKYTINGLTQGVYKYRATTSLNNKIEVSRGEFIVKEMEIEAINTTADFNLLRNVASETGGNFYQLAEINKLSAQLQTNKPADIVHVQEEIEEVLNLEWVLGLLLVLASVEWFFRKFKGGY